MKLSEAIAAYWLAKELNFAETIVPGYWRTFARFIAFVGDR